MKRLNWLSFVGITVLSVVLLTACSEGGSGQQPFGIRARAPAFALPDATGDEVSLSDYEGQPVLLYFHMAVG